MDQKFRLLFTFCNNGAICLYECAAGVTLADTIVLIITGHFILRGFPRVLGLLHSQLG